MEHVMENTTTNTATRTFENTALFEVVKIIAFGSVFPLIYLIGKLITQL